MCSEVSKIDDAPQRGLVFFLQRFQDFFIAVFAEQLVAVFVRGSRWVMRFVILLQVQHCQFAQGFGTGKMRTILYALLQYRGRRSSYMSMYTYVLGHFVPVE